MCFDLRNIVISLSSCQSLLLNLDISIYSQGRLI